MIATKKKIKAIDIFFSLYFVRMQMKKNFNYFNKFIKFCQKALNFLFILEYSIEYVGVKNNSNTSSESLICIILKKKEFFI